MTALERAFWESIALFGTLALFFWVINRVSSIHPSEATLGRLAEIGAAFLVAYAVEASWLVSAARRRPAENRERRVGHLAAAGTVGLAGIALSLLLSERAASGSWSWPEELGFSVVLVSLLLLGISIVMQPLMVHEWSDEAAESPGSAPGNEST